MLWKEAWIDRGIVRGSLGMCTVVTALIASLTITRRLILKKRNIETYEVHL